MQLYKAHISAILLLPLLFITLFKKLAITIAIFGILIFYKLLTSYLPDIKIKNLCVFFAQFILLVSIVGALTISLLFFSNWINH